LSLNLEKPFQQLVEALGTDLQTVDGCPLWEFIEEHPTCYEFVIVMSDSGFGAEVFIPKTGIDADLLALCQLHATPAQEGIRSMRHVHSPPQATHRGGFFSPIERRTA
jgi:hypothetical protein